MDLNRRNRFRKKPQKTAKNRKKRQKTAKNGKKRQKTAKNAKKCKKRRQKNDLCRRTFPGKTIQAAGLNITVRIPMPLRELVKKNGGSISTL
jgi:hypothetical protein